MNKKYRKILFLFIVFIITKKNVFSAEIDPKNIHAAGIYNIKETYSIVNDKYHYLSLLHGVIAWETGFIRNLYDFGEIAFDEKTKKFTDGHAVVRLVHSFFYRIPGSTCISDFGETKQLKKLSKATKETKAIELPKNTIIDTIALFLKNYSEARDHLKPLYKEMNEIKNKLQETNDFNENNILILFDPDLRKKK